MHCWQSLHRALTTAYGEKRGVIKNASIAPGDIKMRLIYTKEGNTMRDTTSRGRFGTEKTAQPAAPKTLLEYDLQRANALGYGCHYGDYKADHPNTRGEFERLTETTRRAATSVKLGTCLHCGKEFEQGQYHRKYCSAECQKRFNTAKNYKRKTDTGKTVACPICGTEFVTKNQHHKYCSSECYTEGQRKLHKKQREERKKEAITNGSI